MGVPVTRPETAGDAALPDGYIVSTARDLADYARFQMGDGTGPDGTRLLSADLLHEMHTAHVTVPGLPLEMASYGMGWFCSRKLPHRGLARRDQLSLSDRPRNAPRRGPSSRQSGRWTVAGWDEASHGCLDRGATTPRHRAIAHVSDRHVDHLARAGGPCCDHRVLTHPIPAPSSRWPTSAPLGSDPAPARCGLASCCADPAGDPGTGLTQRAWRFGWQAAPDVVALELAWVLTLMWIGLRALANSMNSRRAAS